jgi:predicted DNA binding CopG/RHH family protein
MSLEYELIKTLATVVLGCVFGGIGAYIAALIKFRELDKTYLLKVQELKTAFGLKVQEMQKQIEIQQEADQKREQALLRLKYLQPLRVAVEEFIERIDEINVRISDHEEMARVKNWFEIIKHNHQVTRKQFVLWCHYEGNFAMTTLYITATYFAYAVKALSDEPFRELNADYSESLNQHLQEVRSSLGGRLNVWEKSQDIIGRSVITGDTLVSYREFCSSMVEDSDESKYPEFMRLIDFYREIDMKKENIDRLRVALDKLKSFLNRSPGVQ